MNTANEQYYPTNIVNAVRLWVISPAEEARYLGMLNTPYDIPGVARAVVTQHAQQGAAGAQQVAPAIPAVANAAALQLHPLAPPANFGVGPAAAAAGGQAVDDNDSGSNASGYAQLVSNEEAQDEGDRRSDAAKDRAQSNLGAQDEDEADNAIGECSRQPVGGRGAGGGGSNDSGAASGNVQSISNEQDNDNDSDGDGDGDNGASADPAQPVAVPQAPGPAGPQSIAGGAQTQQQAVDKLIHELEPLSGLRDRYPTPFRQEAALVSRMDGSVFLDLSRVQRWTAHKAETTPGWLPAEHRLVFNEPGSTAKLNGRFLPDRCAVQEEGSVDQPTFCPGDIKPSYKFQSSWIRIARNPTMRRSPFYKEYKKVLAQVKFYMEQCSFVPERNGTVQAARYSHIITDDEVVLIRRHLDEHFTLEVTKGFRWRNPPQGEWSGMHALNFIHWLASDETNNTVHR